MPLGENKDDQGAQGVAKGVTSTVGCRLSLCSYGYSCTNVDEMNEQFWSRSLELEPRERDDERMARLLQESGFL